MNPIKPPIPSPDGDTTIETTMPALDVPMGVSIGEEAVSVAYSASGGRLVRGGLKVHLLIPLVLPFSLIVAAFLTLISLPVWMPLGVGLIGIYLLNLVFLLLLTPITVWAQALWSRALRGATLTTLTHNGVHEREPHKTTSYSWPQAVLIVVWGGDLFLVRWTGAIYVPREAFASPEQAALFAQIARRLKASNGQEWPHELIARLESDSRDFQSA